MDFISFFILLVISVVVSFILHYLLSFYAVPGLQGFLAKIVIGWPASAGPSRPLAKHHHKLAKVGLRGLAG